MKALNRKLLRDLRQMKAQLLSIAAIVACGVGAVLAMRTTLDSMQRSSSEYYAQSHFPHVFATASRVPERVAVRIAEIEGVTAVETRVTAGAVLKVPRMEEPATGHFVSIPDEGQPLQSRLYIRRGRFLETRAPDEVLINEHFAAANELEPGDSLAAVINGRWREFQIVGIALSPEFVHDAVPSSGLGMFGDSKHTAVLWIRRSALAPVHDMDGAFNDVTLLLTSGANPDKVISTLDEILKPYGGGHAYGRKDQLSSNIVAGELEQLRVFGFAMPLIFLAVAAYLLNIVLLRLIATQREVIASLKAFGYSNRAIGIHYLGYAAAAIGLGSIGGVALGIWVGGKYTLLYRSFFRFPNLEHYTDPWLVVIAVLVSSIAAALGALTGVRGAVSLPPAEGMRPPAPAEFKRLWMERLGLEGMLSPATRMVVRNMERRPVRALASIIGVAFATAILVVGVFGFDTARYLGDTQFERAERQDLTVSFARARPLRAAREIAHIEGVTALEPYRAAAARIRAGHRSRQVVITGLEPDAEMRRIVGRDGERYPVPSSGVVLTSALGEILDVRAGDTVDIEILEKGSRTRQQVVAGLADELLGLSGYMSLASLNRVAGEGRVVTGVHLTIDPAMESSVLASLRNLPGVSGSATRRALMKSFDAQIAQSLRLTVAVVVSLACVVALGVIYNGLRIALSERSRELASLRVLGFTRREVASLLFREQGIINGLGTPLGLFLGVGLAYWIVTGFRSELYRFPVIVQPRTYLFAVSVILVASVSAALVMKKRIYGLDLVAVLKTRE